MTLLYWLVITENRYLSQGKLASFSHIALLMKDLSIQALQREQKSLQSKPYICFGDGINAAKVAGLTLLSFIKG